MNQIEIYQTKDKQTEIEVQFEEETVWLSQKQMAVLFKNSVPNVNMHIRNIYREKELNKPPAIKESLIVRKEGKRLINRKVELYNLDVIISVGYRVKSKRGTQFRQWATQRLKDHLVKGYTLNEKRLKQVVQNLQQLEQAVKPIQQSALRKIISALFRHSINTHISLMTTRRNIALSETSYNTMRSL